MTERIEETNNGGQAVVLRLRISWPVDIFMLTRTGREYRSLVLLLRFR